MEKEQIKNGAEKERESLEENELEKSLRGLSEHSNKEVEVIREVEDQAEGASEEFMKKNGGEWVMNNLRGMIKKNKLVRAALVGLSLYNANPALASILNENTKEQNFSDKISSEKESESLNFQEKLNQFPNISEEYRSQLESVYGSASNDNKKIIEKALEGDLTEEELSGLGEDRGILRIQQQVIDLQNKGEMGVRKEGGVVLPFDEGHSGRTDGVEKTNDSLAEDGGKQELTINNATPREIVDWINYLKK